MVAMAYTEHFTDAERAQLREANAIRARVKEQRRQRQREADYQKSENAKKQRAIDDAEAKAKRDAKDDFDKRVRTVLLSLMENMKEQNVHLIMNPHDGSGFSTYTNRLKVLTMVETKESTTPLGRLIVIPPAEIYWVRGKGFEWQ